MKVFALLLRNQNEESRGGFSVFLSGVPILRLDVLRGKYIRRRNGNSHLDLAAAEREAGIKPRQVSERAALQKKLAELAPEFLERYENGEITSIRQAAIVAGIHVDTPRPAREVEEQLEKKRLSRNGNGL